MYEEYDEYDDYDDYNHDDYDESKYKHYFKFDPQAWDAWGKWLYDALNDVVEGGPNVWYVSGIPNQSFPVNGYTPIYGDSKKASSYIGNNQYNEPIWKKNYFVVDRIAHAYIKHIESNAVYFLKQPSFYKGLFDILN